MKGIINDMKSDHEFAFKQFKAIQEGQLNECQRGEEVPDHHFESKSGDLLHSTGIDCNAQGNLSSIIT